MSSPLIGITTRRIAATALGAVPLGVADAEIDGVFDYYSESVAAAGGVPVLIPRASDPELLVMRLDGLVLSGGEDVEPSRYGAVAGPHATRHDPRRDAFEIALIEAALHRGLPILAICRGVQILNVALGGTLVEHLDADGGFDHAMTDEHSSVRRHDVIVSDGCLLSAVLGTELVGGRLRVNSYHHQAIDMPGTGLAVVARAFDGTVEAVEDRSRAVLGVQWHPEMHAGVDPVFDWLIQQVTQGERLST